MSSVESPIIDTISLKNLDENRLAPLTEKQVQLMSEEERKLYVKNIDKTVYKTDKNHWRILRKAVEKFSEPLLMVDKTRKGLYPLKYPGIWAFFTLHLSLHWTQKDIDLSKDVNDWNNASEGERHFLEFIIAFFASSDFIVNENQEKDDEDVKVHEHKIFNHDKMSREDTHSITYADLLEAYVKDPVRREYLKNAVMEIPAVKEKAAWIREYIEHGTFVERVVAISIVEGIFFSGSFCGIYWMKKRGKLPGLCDSNELIARDEGLHRDYACYQYRELIVNPFPNEIVIDMIKSSVLLEQEFVTVALPVNLIGMNNEMMSQYIEYVADHLYFNLCNQQIFFVANPFDDWLTAISLKTKLDFFVGRSNNYSDQQLLATDEENEIRADDFTF